MLLGPDNAVPCNADHETSASTRCPQTPPPLLVDSSAPPLSTAATGVAAAAMAPRTRGSEAACAGGVAAAAEARWCITYAFATSAAKLRLLASSRLLPVLLPPRLCGSWCGSGLRRWRACAKGLGLRGSTCCSGVAVPRRCSPCAPASASPSRSREPQRLTHSPPGGLLPVLGLWPPRPGGPAPGATEPAA